MATARSGQNPGRTGQPARQNPAPARQGRADAGIDPTNQEGQTPSTLVGGFHSGYSTGLAGTAGASRGEDADVTLMPGQLDEGFAGIGPDVTADTGLHGTAGGHPAHGGETVTYTDPWGYIGGVNRDVSTQLQIGGPEDSTKFIDGYSPGASLPGLESNRPTDTGVGNGKPRSKRS
jgi:hypothetical protein